MNTFKILIALLAAFALASQVVACTGSKDSTDDTAAQ